MFVGVNVDFIILPGTLVMPRELQYRNCSWSKEYAKYTKIDNNLIACMCILVRIPGA